MNSQEAYQYFEKSGVVGGMRGAFPPPKALQVARALMSAGINVFELTMNSEEPIKAMQAIKKEFGDAACVGMGTVLSTETLYEVIDAGADFVVSPAFQPDVVHACLQKDVMIAPGVITPSEAVQAWNMGVPLLKLFPIGNLGVDYFKSLFGPLDHMKFMCNGAVNDTNSLEFLKAGATVIGMSGWLTGDSTWDDDRIRQRAQRIRDVVQEARTGQPAPVSI